MSSSSSPSLSSCALPFVVISTFLVFVSAILLICAIVRLVISSSHARKRDASRSEQFTNNGFASLMLAGDSTAQFGQSGALVSAIND
jgi:high-affinity Fe2+/Pb2+ permease